MKIIDEKGKLFGLINVIDLAVVLILVLLVVGGAKRFKSKPVVSSGEKEALITMEVSDVRMTTVENIKVGDVFYHYDKGGLIGEIVKVDHEPYREPVEKDGTWVNAEVPEKYTVTFVMEATVKDNPDNIIAGGEQMRIGNQHRVKSKDIACFGTIMAIEILD